MNLHTDPEDNLWCDGGCAQDECVCVSDKMLTELKRLKVLNQQLLEALQTCHDVLLMSKYHHGRARLMAEKVLNKAIGNTCVHFKNVDRGIECTAKNCPCDLYEE